MENRRLVINISQLLLATSFMSSSTINFTFPILSCAQVYPSWKIYHFNSFHGFYISGSLLSKTYTIWSLWSGTSATATLFFRKNQSRHHTHQRADHGHSSHRLANVDMSWGRGSDLICRSSKSIQMVWIATSEEWHLDRVFFTTVLALVSFAETLLFPTCQVRVRFYVGHLVLLVLLLLLVVLPLLFILFASFASQWASPDLRRGPSDQSRQRRTSTARKNARKNARRNVKKKIRR